MHRIISRLVSLKLRTFQTASSSAADLLMTVKLLVILMTIAMGKMNDMGQGSWIVSLTKENSDPAMPELDEVSDSEDEESAATILTGPITATPLPEGSTANSELSSDTNVSNNNTDHYEPSSGVP